MQYIAAFQVERDLTVNSDESRDVVDMITNMQELIDEAGFDVTDNDEILAINEFLQNEIGIDIDTTMEAVMEPVESKRQLLVDYENSSVGNVAEDHSINNLVETNATNASNGSVENSNSTLQHEQNKFKQSSKKKNQKVHQKSSEPPKKNTQTINSASNKLPSSNENEPSSSSSSRTNDSLFAMDQPTIDIQNIKSGHSNGEIPTPVTTIEHQIPKTHVAISLDAEKSENQNAAVTNVMTLPIPMESSTMSNQGIEGVQPHITAETEVASRSSKQLPKPTKLTTATKKNKRQVKHSKVTTQRAQQLVPNESTNQATSGSPTTPIELNIEHSDSFSVDTTQQTSLSVAKINDDTHDLIEEVNVVFSQADEGVQGNEVEVVNQIIDQNINTPIEISYDLQDEEVIEEIADFQQIQPEQTDIEINNVERDDDTVILENLSQIQSKEINQILSPEQSQENVDLTTESKPSQQNLSELVYDTKRLIQVSTHIVAFELPNLL